MKPADQGTVWRTPAQDCPACRERRCHRESEWREFHPYRNHGFSGREWSHPALAPAAKAAGSGS